MKNCLFNPVCYVHVHSKQNMCNREKGNGTSRIQTVSKNEPTIFRAILEEWKKRTGCSVLLNTSLNIRGEPMVNNISDANRFEEKYGVKVFY